MQKTLLHTEPTLGYINLTFGNFFVIRVCCIFVSTKQSKIKVTLLTGVSAGIGEALAGKLGARKHNLLIVARNADKLAIQSKQLAERLGINAQFIAADLARPEVPETIFTEVQNLGLEVVMLINNAGIGSGGEFTELSLRYELEMMQLNNSAMVALTHYFLPVM